MPLVQCMSILSGTNGLCWTQKTGMCFGLRYGKVRTKLDRRATRAHTNYELSQHWVTRKASIPPLYSACYHRGLMETIADVVRMLDNMPELSPHIRRVRGGYLKIQGTWMKYEVSIRCILY
jgi:hypothetical protein